MYFVMDISKESMFVFIVHKNALSINYTSQRLFSGAIATFFCFFFFLYWAAPPTCFKSKNIAVAAQIKHTGNFYQLLPGTLSYLVIYLLNITLFNMRQYFFLHHKVKCADQC